MMQIPANAMNHITGAYGTHPGHLKYLGGGAEWSDGIVYEYRDGDTDKALKFMLFPGDDTTGLEKLSERLQFVHYLGENDVSIVYPKFSQNGNLYESCTENGKTYIGYSMDKLQGGDINSLSAEDLHDFYLDWGRVLGKLHACSKSYPRKVDQELFGWRQEWTFFEGWCQDEGVRGAWRELKTELEKLPRDPDSYGFIHNDPHPYNMFIHNKRITLFDFDVANYHWYMTDIGIAVYSALGKAAGGFEIPQADRRFPAYFIDRFMNGYEQFNHMPSSWMDKMELFLSYRRVILFTATYNSLQQNADHFNMWRKRIMSHAPILTY